MSQQTDQINSQLVKAVVDATLEVMSTMAYTRVTMKDVQEGDTYRTVGDISALIGVFGDNGDEGMLSVSFSMDLARIVVARLLGTESDKLSTEDLCDGVRELVNMISGNTKTLLYQGSTTHYRLSLPTLILGHEHEVNTSRAKHPYLLFFFETDVNIEGFPECFVLQVSLESQN